LSVMATASLLWKVVCALLLSAGNAARPLEGAQRSLLGKYVVEEYQGPGDKWSKRYHEKWLQFHEKFAEVAGKEAAEAPAHKYMGTDKDAVKLMNKRLYYQNKYKLALQKAEAAMAKNPAKFKAKIKLQSKYNGVRAGGEEKEEEEKKPKKEKKEKKEKEEEEEKKEEAEEAAEEAQEEAEEAAEEATQVGDPAQMPVLDLTGADGSPADAAEAMLG